LGEVDVRRLRPPEALADRHEVDDFRCSERGLEDWLKERARSNDQGGASRTYVVCDGASVVGYYSLSAGAVSRRDAPSPVRRNMPEPIPVVLLGRLAVHEAWTNRGIGEGLLKDAVLRSISAAEKIGVRALLCHALSERAKAFYLKHGFAESPLSPSTLMLPLSALLG